ncbi:PK beta-barrel-protein domain-containing protein-like protein [Xylaria castorea]|nr:PK beta-barrel-protein domain-containing protein-like protein [Xylaria castorea]
MSVYAVAAFPSHEFSKELVGSITLAEGLGVEGDCHYDKTDQHLSRLHIKPPPANLRQVHLIPFEVLTECVVQPAEIGENVTTTGIDLLTLGSGTKLHFITAGPTSEMMQEPHTIIQLQGVRNPVPGLTCSRIDMFRPGLKEKFVVRNEHRAIIGRKAGAMGIVEALEGK